MNYFKQKTIGHPVIMGRKTYDSLRFKPLPNRFNIVLTKDEKLNGVITEGDDGPLYMNHIVDALDYIDGTTNEVFIIGGEQIYQEALNLDLVDRMYINVMNAEYEGDARFPYYDSKFWKTQESEEKYNDFKSYVIIKKKDDE